MIYFDGLKEQYKNKMYKNYENSCINTKQK